MKKNYLFTSESVSEGHPDKVYKMLNTTEKGSIEINSVSNAFPTFFSVYGNKIFFFLVFIYISLIFFLKKLK